MEQLILAALSFLDTPLTATACYCLHRLLLQLLHRNKMEQLTLAALSCLDTTVIFVIDLTEECGCSVQDQWGVRCELKRRFPAKAWLDVFSKADMLHTVRAAGAAGAAMHGATVSSKAGAGGAGMQEATMSSKAGAGGAGMQEATWSSNAGAGASASNPPELNGAGASTSHPQELGLAGTGGRGLTQGPPRGEGNEGSGSGLESGLASLGFADTPGGLAADTPGGLAAALPGAVWVSSLTRHGIPQLQQAIITLLQQQARSRLVGGERGGGSREGEIDGGVGG